MKHKAVYLEIAYWLIVIAIVAGLVLLSADCDPGPVEPSHDLLHADVTDGVVTASVDITGYSYVLAVNITKVVVNEAGEIISQDELLTYAKTYNMPFTKRYKIQKTGRYVVEVVLDYSSKRIRRVIETVIE